MRLAHGAPPQAYKASLWVVKQELLVNWQSRDYSRLQEILGGSRMKSSKALEKAIKVVGSQSALARSCNVSQQAVHQWIAAGRVPVHQVRSVVSATHGAVSANDLRPDIFLPANPA
jgi:hypothetical protein